MPAVPTPPKTQQRITLRARPTGPINPDLTSGNGTFVLEKEAQVDSQVNKGEALVKTEYVSLDPAMRGAFNISSVVSSAPSA